MFETTAKDMMDFIARSPTCFHAVRELTALLDAAGYRPLAESQLWTLEQGGSYYLTRNGSSVIAFQIPCRDFSGFQIAASHSDSPSFKLKHSPALRAEGCYTKLNVEKYGGMLMAPWFDRPLSIAGRVIVRTDGGFESHLVNVARDLVMIPNLAIHMNRTVNEGYAYDPQKDLLPLYGDETAADTLPGVIADAAGVRAEDVLGADLFLYNRMAGTVWGANGEYISSPRLDDLQCAWATTQGFLAAAPGTAVPVLAVFDNEEVGSGTKQGACSTLLRDTLARINRSLGRTPEQYHTAIANSFLVSADNAHAVHPNRGDVADPVNRPVMNRGIVIKHNANQKYTTDAVSCALFQAVCKEADVPCQHFTNRSDMAGGSTLGNLSNTQVSVNAVDIGLAQLAMHSPYETAGVRDTAYLVRAMTRFFGASLLQVTDGRYQLRF